MLIRVSHPTVETPTVMIGYPENPTSQEGEEDRSGTQFVCETIIRSLILDAAPFHKPLQRKKSFITVEVPTVMIEYPENPTSQEEGEEDMSGTQFVCETVIRSLTLDAAPDHKPLQRKKSLQSECLNCPLYAENTVWLQKTSGNSDILNICGLRFTTGSPPPQPKE